MSKPEHNFAIASLRVSSPNERVRVIGENRQDLDVNGKAHVTTDGGRVTIDAVRSALLVRIPEGTSVVIGTNSGRVSVEGRVGDVAVVTVSGRVSVERAASVDIRTESGRVEVDHAGGDCRIRTVSGRVSVGSCRDADAATTSGRVTLGAVSGAVRAHCISGRIEAALSIANDVDAETVSGRISIELPSGTRALRLDQTFGDKAASQGYDCTINARSVSGRVDVSNR